MIVAKKALKAGLRIFSSENFWGILGVFLRLGTPLIFLPALLTRLSSVELGLWYLLSSIIAFASAFDSALQATVSRAASVLLGGAEKLIGLGIAAGKSTEPNISGLEKLIPTARKIWIGGGVLAFALMGLATPWLFYKFGSSGIPSRSLALYWSTVSVTVLLNYLAGFPAAIATGLGAQKACFQRAAFVQAAQILLGFLVLYLGGGLGCLLLLFSGLGIVQWIWNEATFGLVCRMKSIRRMVSGFDREVASALWPTAWRSYVVTIGGFLITQVSTFLCAGSKGLDSVGAWGLTMQALNFSGSMAYIWIYSGVPHFARIRASGDMHAVVGEFGWRLKMAMLSCVACGLGLLICGPWLIHLIGSKTSLLPMPLLMIAVLMQTVEVFAVSHSILVATDNRNPFVIPSLLSGFALSIVGWWAVSHYGEAGLLYARIAIQSTCVWWLCVVLAIRSVRMSTGSYARAIFESPLYQRVSQKFGRA